MDEVLVVMGQGYVGVPLAVRAVEVGFSVVGFDIDETKVKGLASGRSPVEDVSDERLQAALSSGRYTPTAEIADCRDFNAAVISVPTPLRDGMPDLSAVESAARFIAPLVRSGTTVVLESTTYPGTTEELLCPILEEGSGLRAGRDFHVGYSPERIDPGNARWTVANTPKVVSGIDAEALDAVKALFDRIVESTVPVSTTKAAELAKLLENTFRHVNIALVNELAVMAHGLGIDLWEAIDAAATKPFGFMKFTPGPGVGGHCLPIDPSYLSWSVERNLGRNFRFVELANDINDHMPHYVVQRLVEGLNRRRQALRGSRILLLGLAYKPNTGDARESPALAVIDELDAWGADIRVVDPYVDDEVSDARYVRVELDEQEVTGAAALLLLTDHDTFDYELVLRHASYILDTRRRVAGPQVEYL